MLRLSIGKAAIGVLSVAALTACGNVQGGSDFGVERSEDAVQAQLQDLYDLTWGSPRARQALEVIEYVKRQEDVAACLAARSLTHSPAPFVDGTAPKRPALSWFDVLVPTDEDRVAVDGLGPRPLVALEVTPSKKWPGRSPSPGDLKKCEEQGGISSIPAVDPELDTKLHRLVGEAPIDACRRSWSRIFSVKAPAQLYACVQRIEAIPSSISSTSPSPSPEMRWGKLLYVIDGEQFKNASETCGSVKMFVAPAGD